MELGQELENIKQAIQEIRENLSSDYAFYKMSAEASLLTHDQILQKLREESQSLDQELPRLEEVIQDVLGICRHVRARGVLALHELISEVKGEYLRNLLTLVSARPPHNLPYYRVTYLLLPYLLSHRLRGIEFVKTVLYHEGVLMSTTGYPPEQIHLRLSGVLGQMIQM